MLYFSFLDSPTTFGLYERFFNRIIWFGILIENTSKAHPEIESN